MRVLLTGSTGRLGGAFLSLWGREGSGYDVIPLTRHHVNLSQGEQLRSTLERFWGEKPYDVIINPAALSGLEECLDHPELAQAVNVEAPRVMAEFATERHIKFVHFSTDYVFGGGKKKRLRETVLPDPVNVYGRSKLAGEHAVMQCGGGALVCRVSWLFGPSGPLAKAKPSHFDHVLRRAVSGENQYLIEDKYSVPTFTHDIVQWVDALLRAQTSGIYHLCNSSDPESWLSYAEKVCWLARRFGYDVTQGSLNGTSIEDADFFRETRPVHTAMLPARLIDEGIVLPRHWLAAAEEYFKIR